MKTTNFLARHMLSDAYGQWRRICTARPHGLLAIAKLENGLDATLWNYSER